MTGFLLDTNVISEVARPQPTASVLAWLAEVDQESVFLSVATLAELRYGVERLPQGQRRKRLHEWLAGDLMRQFDRRVLGIDEAVAHTWGQIVDHCDRVGRPIGVMDGFLAATAVVHNLVLVTRNEPDFQAVVKTIVNPWRL